MILEKIPYLRVLISLSVLGEGARWFRDLDERPAEEIGFQSCISAAFMMVIHLILLIVFVIDFESSDSTGGSPVDGRADLAFFASVFLAHALFGDWGLNKL